MLRLAGLREPAAKASAARVMALETELAKASKTRVERRDPAGLYNKIDRAGIVKAAPAFPWDRYFRELGRPELQDLVVTSVPFFEGVQRLVNTGKPDDWRAYLQWHVVRSFAPALPKAFVDEQFAMTAALTGQQQLEERWKRCVKSTDGALGELLAQPFVARRFAGDSKDATEQMVREISRAFSGELDRLDWMDPTTKERARQKLGSFVYHIGYPERWRTYDFPIGPHFAANAMASRQHELRRELAKIGQPVDRQEWHMSPPTVNAYYNPLKNEMVFPAGILQPPFFDRAASIAVNLGGMGMVVGHELTHGFDDEGSKFDADGNLSDWWDEATRARFTEKTQCVEEQYAQYEALPGVPLNGKLTLGENIADIGGVKLGFEAYRRLRAEAPEKLVAEGFTEDQQFFLSVGQVWCTKAREEVARMLAQVDPHSPPKWRVNGSLVNVPEFGEAFGCEVGTPMRPREICRVW
jgi:putative endopeptidase